MTLLKTDHYSVKIVPLWPNGFLLNGYYSGSWKPLILNLNGILAISLKTPKNMESQLRKLKRFSDQD